MEEALFLARFASKVTMVHRREVFRASKIMLERAQNHEKIDIITNSRVIEVLEKTMTGVRLEDTVTGETRELKRAECLWPLVTNRTPRFWRPIDQDERGYLVTKPDSSYTNVEGVFACGDVQDHVYRQAVTAAGSGCMAAIDTERWLESQGEG